MDIDPKYSEPDPPRTRPRCCARKTGLKDMFIELDPGTDGAPPSHGGLHDPGRRDRAGRQPGRDPRDARRRHARLPQAADQRRRRGPEGPRHDLREVFAPLRADAPRPRARHTRGRATRRENLRQLITLAEHAQRRAGQARRRPRRRSSTPRRPCCTRSPPRTRTSPRAVSELPARAAADDATRCARSSATPTCCGPTATDAAPGRARARPAPTRRSRPFATRGDAAAARRHPPVRARGAPARARPAPGRAATWPTPTPDAHAARSTRSTTSSTCSPTTRTAREDAGRRGPPGGLPVLARPGSQHMATQLFSTSDANGAFRPVTHRRARARRSSDRRTSSRSSSSCAMLTADPHRLGRPARADAEAAPITRRGSLTMVVFALSCFGLLLFLWLSFGGPVPLKPKGYRVQVAFPEAATLGRPRPTCGSPACRSARCASSTSTSGGNRTLATIELDRQFAPLHTDARAILRQKTLLGETYVRAHARPQRGEGCPRAAGWPTARSSTPSSSTRSSTRSTRRRARRSGPGSRSWRRAIKGRGHDLNDALGNAAGLRRRRRRRAARARRRSDAALQPPGQEHGRRCSRR